MLSRFAAVSVSLILKASRLQGPLQVPNEFYAKFSYVEETDKPTHERQTYHAMVDFADQAIGNFTKALKAKGFAFVGPKCCYSLMQSCGLVVDHPAGTPEHAAALKRSG